MSTYYARYDASHHELLLDPHAVQEIVQQVDASVREDALDILMWHEAGHVLAEDLFSCTQTLATLQDLEAQRVYLAMMEGYAQAAARRMARARSTEVTMNSLIDKVWSGLDYWDEAPERSLSEPYDHTLRADTTSMYVDGERLVESLMRAGGEQLVAAAFSAPPGQLEVLSDPELYASLARHANAGDDSVIGEFLRESAREAQRIATELEGSALPGVTLKSATLSAIAYELRFQDYRLGLPASILTDACRALVIDDHSNGFQSTQVLLGGVTFETREGAARAFARLSELNSSYAIRGRDHYRELTGFSLGESVGRDLDCSNSYRSSLRVPDQSASETLRDLMRERFYYSACLFESTIVEGVFAHEVGASLDRDGILREMLTQIKR